MSFLTRYTGGTPHISGRALNYPDQVVALFALGAILAAVVMRNRSGQGAHLDLSQRELTAFLVGEATLTSDSAGLPSNPVESGIDFQGIFRAGDGLQLAVTIPQQAAAAVSSLLAHAATEISLAAWIGTLPSTQVVAELRAVGVAAEVIVSGKVAGEGALQTRNAFSRDANNVSVKGFPIRMGATDIAPSAAAPTLGQHNREIALERLGLSLDAYTALVDANIFAARPAKARA